MNAGDELIALLDVGKSHAKLALLERGSGVVHHRVEQSVRAIAGQYCRELNIAAIEAWLITQLAGAPEKQRIGAIVPVAHGAAAVLIDAAGQKLVAPDYEDATFSTVADAYDLIRDPYSDTLSPSLMLGLNLGRQLFYLQEKHPDVFAKIARIVLYPQYWAARLSGEFASEITSLGCHTDLWLPSARRYSPLAVRRGWSKLFPPLRSACDALGSLAADVVQATGLNPACRVLCGIHDSNASFLGHIANRKSGALAVISSGTWTVIMNRNGELDDLREDKDMLANVDAFGQPVATARFMGGREYETIAGDTRATPTIDALSQIVKLGALALPSFAPAGGPFANRKGRLINANGLNDAQRPALATAYVALMCDWLLDELNPDLQECLTIVVDGPLASNPLFATLLRALRPDDIVNAGDGREASVAAAHFLATGTPLTPSTPLIAENAAVDAELLSRYRSQWRDALTRQRAA